MKPTIAWQFSDWDANVYRRENDLYGGIGYYRVIKPSQVLRKWFDIEVIGADFQHWGTTEEKYTRLGRDYDLIISKHLRTGEDASNTLAAAKHFKKKVLVDFDDDYLNMLPDNPAFDVYAPGALPRGYLSAFIELADGITVSTDPLKKLYKPLNKHIDVLPNCNDINDWPNIRKRWDDGKIRIGFAGGAAHQYDLALVLEPMSYILAKYPNVFFEICGALTADLARGIGVKMNEYCKKNITSQILVRDGTLAWQGYPEMLTSFGWDIVIAPLVDESFNRGKSHIRWMESAMIYAPVVASPVYPYKEDIQGVKTIVDGATGFFASNTEEWFTKLDALVNDKDLRQSIATNAYKYVKENWQYEQWADKWKKVITRYL